MSKGGFNRQRARRKRRRVGYPKLQPLQVATIERPECGRNDGVMSRHSDGRTIPGRVAIGVFQFTRAWPKLSRSKYDPNTENIKHGTHS